MGALDTLEPKAVMHWFEEIAAIPHGSLKEEKLSAYIMQFARERGLACREDAAHNVMVCKKASPGYEGKEPLVLQSHMDMIWAKEPGVTHDFENDGLDLYIDGDKIRARGTTLGADNGIGVAYQLAILDDKTLAHPAIEAVFTTAEEIGMVGAIRFDTACLTGRRMINFDAGGFTEGRIYVGCAGNQHGLLTRKVTFVPRDTADVTLRITLGGLQGGHSGGDIGKGRGNSSVILGRLLSLLCADDTARVAWFQSGDAAQTNKHGIPAESTLCVCTKDADGVKEQVRTFEKVLRDELSDVDDGVTLCVMEEKSRSQRVLSPESTAALRQLLAVLPNGVQTMQRAFPDTPECSCNLGNVELEDDTVSCYVSVRSCKTTLIDMVCERHEAIAQLVGGSIAFDNRLPAWDYRKDSPLRMLVEAEYKKEFGASPRFKVTHASTECAIFCREIPDMDIISMGPIIYEEHTPKEYMGIASVGILWEFVKNILRQL